MSTPNGELGAAKNALANAVSTIKSQASDHSTSSHSSIPSTLAAPQSYWDASYAANAQGSTTHTSNSGYTKGGSGGSFTTTTAKNSALAYDPAEVAIAQASGAAKSVIPAATTSSPTMSAAARAAVNAVAAQTKEAKAYQNQINAAGTPIVDVYGNGGTTPAATGASGSGSGGSGGGGGYSGGGSGYSGDYSSILGQLGAGYGIGTGVGTAYTPITQDATANAEQNAAAYAELLRAAGYDLTQPLTSVDLPNYVELPNRVDLPDNFNFQEAWNNTPDVNVGRINHIDTQPEEGMLEQLADLQRQQAILSADNTVRNGIVDLQRTMQNAQQQYEAQRNQIAADEARALDNQVLYSEARGDRGGIGQAQYNTIQNTAATNRLTVQKEQTQLATDTARQIADLRSQGEFEKANQLLSISQKYLSELMDLYQWAKETNLGIDEFNLQVAQWEENFKLSLVGAELDAQAFNLNLANAMIDQENNLFNARYNQENSLFDARLKAAQLQNDEANARLNAQLNAANATGAFGNGTPTYAAQQNAIANQLKERELLADVGTALIKAGIQPSGAILEAMGMGGAVGYGAGYGALGLGTSALAGTAFEGMDAESVLRSMGIGSSGLAGLAQLGYTPESFLAEALGTGTGTLSGLESLNLSTLPAGSEAIYNQLVNAQTAYPNDLAAQLTAYQEAANSAAKASWGQNVATPTTTSASTSALRNMSSDDYRRLTEAVNNQGKTTTPTTTSTQNLRKLSNEEAKKYLGNNTVGGYKS